MVERAILLTQGEKGVVKGCAFICNHDYSVNDLFVIGDIPT